MTKIKLSIILLVISILVITSSYFIIKNRKTIENTNTINNSSFECNNVVVENPVLVELTDAEKDELYSKVHDVAFLHELYDMHHDIPEFTDSEIVWLSTVLDKDDTFKIYEYVYKYASEEDLQKLSQKYFGKKIDFNNVNHPHIEYKNNDYYIAFNTGYGIINYDLNYIKTVGDNEYDISIKYTDYYSNFLGNYILTVEYHDDVLIYKAFRQEI